MNSSASKVGLEKSRNSFVPNLLAKPQAYPCIIAIILGFIGFIICAVGLDSYLHTGVLRNISQIDAIVMMGAGGGSGVILLMIGGMRMIKIQQEFTYQLNLMKRIKMIQSVNTKGGLVYSPEAWKIWNVEILDDIPRAPSIDLSSQNMILLYIPQRVKVNKQVKNLTLNVLKEISGVPFRHFSKKVEKQFGNSKYSGGWVLIDKTVIAESRNKSYEAQKKIVEDQGACMPSLLEAVTLNLMVFAFTDQRLYGQEPWTYTCCAEKIKERYSVHVGSFGPTGLHVRDCLDIPNASVGIAGVIRFEHGF